MAFPVNLEIPIVMTFGDPGVDDKRVKLWTAPRAARVVGATLNVQNAQASGSATIFTVQNWGTAGTAIKAGAAGTVIASLGGTAAAARLAAETPAAGSIVSAVIAAGEHLYIDTQLTGAWIEQQVTMQLDVVYGV